MQEKKSNPITVDDYIAQFPEDLQQILTKIRAVIKESAPEAVKKISYQMPAYYLKGMLVSFAVYKHHIGFYPKTTGMEIFTELQIAYKGTKSSVHFPLDQPTPYELIGKLVKIRVAESLEI
ncbi:MAG: DUF1801 domain-containing protein [Saprospiraceae bacterium]|nr:DUF1801 domain-containing protein [Saprospiraceae bacterium]